MVETRADFYEQKNMEAMKTYKQLVFFLAYWLIYGGLFVQFVGLSRYLEYLPDALVLFLGLELANRRSPVAVHRMIGRAIPVVIVLFLLVGTLSSLTSIFTLSGYLWGLRNYVRYFILFMAIYKIFTWEDVLKLKRIYIKGLRNNIWFILFESVVLGVQGDPLGGTMSGGNSAFYLFMLPGMFMVCCDFFQGRRPWRNLLFYVAGVVYFAIVGESKVVYFTLPFIVYGAYVLVKRFSVGHILTLVLGFLFVIPVFQYFMSFYYSQDYVERIFDVAYVEQETSGTGFGVFNRSTAIELSNVMLLTDAKHFLIGYGLNSASTSNLFPSPLLHYVNLRSISAFNLFTTSYVLSETGWIGFILFVLAHVLLLFRFLKYYRRYSRDKVVRYWSSCGLLSMGMTFLLMWYNNTPVFDYYMMYIFWAMIFVAIRSRLHELKLATRQITEESHETT